MLAFLTFTRKFNYERQWRQHHYIKNNRYNSYSKYNTCVCGKREGCLYKLIVHNYLKCKDY